MRRTGLIFIIIGFFFLQAQAKTVRILLKMIPAQESWFIQNIIKPFQHSQGVTVKIHRFADYNDLEKKVKENPSFDVIKVPMDRAAAFWERNYIAPIAGIADTATLRRIQADYLLPFLATRHDSLLYIPRKLESRIMVFRISKVKEAVETYQTHVSALDAALRKLGFRGMPKDYALEKDPNQWDYFDVLVAGYVWAQAEKEGRVGHRGRNYAGTFLRIIDRAFQFGATRGEIPFVSSIPATEAFQWEHVYARYVYNPAMFKAQWSGEDLWKAFGANKIYLSFLTQLDCFFLRGTGRDGLTGFLKNPDDIDFAVIPKAASLVKEESMLENRNVTTGGWFWAIGRESKEKQLALRLILHMTSLESQKAEFNAFGALPTQKHLLQENTDRLYLKRWRNRLMQVSIKQIKVNRTTVLPFFKDMDKLQQKYYGVLKALCFEPENIKSVKDIEQIITKAEEATRK